MIIKDCEITKNELDRAINKVLFWRTRQLERLETINFAFSVWKNGVKSCADGLLARGL